MQTFLVSDNSLFADTVEALDYKRLGKQRVEAKQILNVLKRGSGGWLHHPAVKMWRGYEEYLSFYHDVCITEWVRRGYKNTMPLFGVTGVSAKRPHWWGDERIYSSHRSNLLRKDRNHYGNFGWTEGPDLPYYWPV